MFRHKTMFPLKPEVQFGHKPFATIGFVLVGVLIGLGFLGHNIFLS